MPVRDGRYDSVDIFILKRVSGTYQYQDTLKHDSGAGLWS